MAEKGHRSLRESIKELTERLDKVEACQVKNLLKFTEIDERKPDVTSLNYPPKIVLSLIMIAFAVGAGQFASAWFSTSGLRDSQVKMQESQSKTQSDVRDILTRMDGEAKTTELKTRLDDANGKSSLLQQVQLADKVNSMEKQITEIARSVQRRP